MTECYSHIQDIRTSNSDWLNNKAPSIIVLFTLIRQLVAGEMMWHLTPPPCPFPFSLLPFSIFHHLVSVPSAATSLLPKCSFYVNHLEITPVNLSPSSSSKLFYAFFLPSVCYGVAAWLRNKTSLWNYTAYFWSKLLHQITFIFHFFYKTSNLHIKIRVHDSSPTLPVFASWYHRIWSISHCLTWITLKYFFVLCILSMFSLFNGSMYSLL